VPEAGRTARACFARAGLTAAGPRIYWFWPIPARLIISEPVIISNRNLFYQIWNLRFLLIIVWHSDFVVWAHLDCSFKATFDWCIPLICFKVTEILDCYLKSRNHCLSVLGLLNLNVLWETTASLFFFCCCIWTCYEKSSRLCFLCWWILASYE
jgi:hypothetical protein